MELRHILMLAIQLVLLAGLCLAVRRTLRLLRQYRQDGVLLHELPLDALRSSMRVSASALAVATRLLALQRCMPQVDQPPRDGVAGLASCLPLAPACDDSANITGSGIC